VPACLQVLLHPAQKVVHRRRGADRLAIVQLRYSFRAYPTPGQQIALARAFGCARVVYNDGLAVRKAAFELGLPRISDAELSKRLTMAKKTPQRAWLGEVSAVVLQQALADLNTAYRNFFNSITGKRKGPKVAPPRFRSRKDPRQSVRFTRNAYFSITPGAKLRLPKIGDLAVRWSRELPADPSSVTIIKDAAGRYFASFVVQVDVQRLPPLDSEVGIDLGLATFAVMSNGQTITSPRFLRHAERKLRNAHKALSRKNKSSANRAKARKRVAKAHAKVADTRRDWAHKHSTSIIRDNQAVFVEDLCVRGLARTRLAKSVHDAGVGHIHPHAGREGNSIRSRLPQSESLVPVDPVVLGVWRVGRQEALACSGVDLHLWCHTRPRPQRGSQYPRGRAGREVIRLRRGCQPSYLAGSEPQ
jgi:putative transposase